MYVKPWPVRLRRWYFEVASPRQLCKLLPTCHHPTTATRCQPHTHLAPQAERQHSRVPLQTTLRSCFSASPSINIKRLVPSPGALEPTHGDPCQVSHHSTTSSRKSIARLSLSLSLDLSLPSDQSTHVFVTCPPRPFRSNLTMVANRLSKPGHHQTQAPSPPKNIHHRWLSIHNAFHAE